MTIGGFLSLGAEILFVGGALLVLGVGAGALYESGVRAYRRGRVRREIARTSGRNLYTARRKELEGAATAQDKARRPH